MTGKFSRRKQSLSACAMYAEAISSCCTTATTVCREAIVSTRLTRSRIGFPAGRIRACAWGAWINSPRKDSPDRPEWTEKRFYDRKRRNEADPPRLPSLPPGRHVPGALDGAEQEDADSAWSERSGSPAICKGSFLHGSYRQHGRLPQHSLSQALRSDRADRVSDLVYDGFTIWVSRIPFSGSTLAAFLGHPASRRGASLAKSKPRGVMTMFLPHTRRAYCALLAIFLSLAFSISTPAQQAGPLPPAAAAQSGAQNQHTANQTAQQQNATAPSAAPPVAATSSSASSAARIQVPTGTHIPLVLHNGISTRSARAGDPVYLETLFPVMVDGRVAIPAGTYVSGEVTESSGQAA